MTDRQRRILLLGSTGKLGQAFDRVFCPNDLVLRHNTGSFDAGDFFHVRELVAESRPDLLINTVAFQGIDQCEDDPDRALRLNTLFPRLLAECAVAGDFTLVHFSTESVFNDALAVPITESAQPCPLSLYGQTKYGGDCFVMNTAPRYYLIRTALLFGPNSRNNQFVERMLTRIANGERTLRVSDDVVTSPTFSVDVAREVMRLVDAGAPHGLYHLANGGQASLHAFMSRLVAGLGLDVTVERASHRDFPSKGRKNTNTPLSSYKLPPLRPWEEALSAYCSLLQGEGTL